MPARILRLLWRLSISPVTFVVLSILWCIDLGIGSLYAYWRSDLFGTLDNYPFTVWLRTEGARAWPASIWVHALVLLTWLMVASLLLCTVNWFLYRRKRLKGLGEVLVHLGFLLVFAGYVVGAVGGSRTLGVTLPIGGSARVEELGATLSLRDMQPLLGPGGSVQGTVNNLELRQGNRRVASRGVKINHPLMDGATVVYPRGARQQVEGVRMIVNNSLPVELLPNRPVTLPTGHRLALARILQADETAGNARGPGVVVAVSAPDGKELPSSYLSSAEGMPTEAAFAGLSLQLAGFSGPMLGVFDVHRDPGVWLVIVGALLITLGTAVAFGFYLREGMPG